jgi:uncharacterized paraquat-inducible protein A
MFSQLPTTRAEATYHDARHFQTGRACRRGHTAPRFTANGNCTACERHRRRRRKRSAEVGTSATGRIKP